MSRIKKAMIGWTRNFDLNGQQTAEYESTVADFDESGQKTTEKIYDISGALERQFQFDSKGHVIQEIHHEPDGSINFRYLFKYDLTGNEIEQTMLLAGDQLHGRWINRIDTLGRIVEREWHNRWDEVEVTETLEYTEGKVAHKIRGAVAEWVYTYNADGNLSHIKGGYFSSDELENVELRYNENGDLIEKIELNPTGRVMKTTRYEYSY